MEKTIKIPTYDYCKNSGIIWLGKIPFHWETEKSQWLFKLRREKARKGDEQLTASQKYGMISQQKFMEIEGRRVTQVEFNPEILKHVEADDFVISMRSFQGGIEYCQESGSVSSAYVPLVPHKHVHSPYFKYLLKSRRYIEALQSTSNLVRDGQALRYENFRMVDLPVVPDQEQVIIAKFLDKKTTQIDEAIAIKEQQIALLKERKQIIIQKAVTQGLDPAVPMKDSGVDWIGDIPAHWDLMALRYAFDFLNSRRIPLSALERESKKGSYPYYGASGIIDYVDDYLFEEDLILIAEDGANLLSKSTPLAFVATGKYWVNNHAHIIKPKFKGFKYWAELLSGFDYTVHISGAAQPKLTRDSLAGVMVSVPPLNEIQDIISYIEEIEPDINRAIEIQRLQIEKLKEYKVTLINSAVTGKIKITPDMAEA